MSDDCEHCGGNGYIPIEEGDPEFEELKKRYGDNVEAYRSMKRCICTKKETFKSKIDGEFSYRENLDIEDSPLMNRLDDDLFIKSERSHFKDHFQLSLFNRIMGKGDWTFHFRYISNRKIIETEFDDDTENGYHSISHLFEPPNLLVIYLNGKGREHESLPTSTLDGLLMRDDCPTWILNDPSIQPFDLNHVSYSPRLSDRFDEHFDTIELEYDESDDHKSSQEKSEGKQVEDEILGDGDLI